MLTHLKNLLAGRSLPMRLRLKASPSQGLYCPACLGIAPKSDAGINVDWNNRVLKIACLTVLMMGSAVAMDVERDLDSLLIRAAKTGSRRQVEQFLKEGAMVNAKDEEGNTALMMAVRDRNIHVCKLLIDNGADMNVSNNQGKTALLIVIPSGDYRICKLLIDNGADVNASDKDGSSALMMAVFFSLKICELLVDHGANVNARDADGYTPLMWAARDGSIEICEFLIAHGANVNAQNKLGETPLIMAGVASVGSYKYGVHEKICKLLIKEMIKQEKKQARTVLYHAVKMHKGIGRDTARMVTQQLQESQKESNAGYESGVEAQIMRIENAKLRKELLDYLNSL